NTPNAFGDEHGVSEDHGLTQRGTSLVEAFAESGIDIDIVHGSPLSGEQVINIAKKRGGRAIASHTGARIGTVVEKSRNITRKNAEALFSNEWKVGVA